jgi:hypothetical protein
MLAKHSKLILINTNIQVLNEEGESIYFVEWIYKTCRKANLSVFTNKWEEEAVNARLQATKRLAIVTTTSLH